MQVSPIIVYFGNSPAKPPTSNTELPHYQPRGEVELSATKTENGRELPIWNCIRDVVQRRISDGLTNGEYLFREQRLRLSITPLLRLSEGRKIAKSTAVEWTGFRATASVIHSLLT